MHATTDILHVSPVTFNTQCYHTLYQDKHRPWNVYFTDEHKLNTKYKAQFVTNILNYSLPHDSKQLETGL